MNCDTERRGSHPTVCRLVPCVCVRLVTMSTSSYLVLRAKSLFLPKKFGKVYISKYRSPVGCFCVCVLACAGESSNTGGLRCCCNLFPYLILCCTLFVNYTRFCLVLLGVRVPRLHLGPGRAVRHPSSGRTAQILCVVCYPRVVDRRFLMSRY